MPLHLFLFDARVREITIALMQNLTLRLDGRFRLGMTAWRLRRRARYSWINPADLENSDSLGVLIQGFRTLHRLALTQGL
jgi:hypothetical protein